MNKVHKVLVTRPREQAVVLAQKLKELGYEASTFPLTEISSLRAEIPKQISSLLIFVSANAVRKGLPQLREAAVDLSGCALHAIGPATASALAAEGLISEAPSSGFRSEELLEHLGNGLSKFSEATIICGAGGRGYLKERLEQQGLEVNRIEVYRRHAAANLDSEFKELLKNEAPDVISVMNGEAVSTFSDLLDRSNNSSWKNIPLAVSSQRIQKIAKKSGFLTVICQPDPTEGGLIELLAQFSQR